MNNKKPGGVSPSSIKLGVSMSASWAWGVSLGVSFSILQTKGLLPFAIWGIFNIFAITIYGLYVMKYKNYFKFTQTKIIKLAMTIIQIFAIWINTKIMYDFIGSAVIATVISLVMICLTLKYKFQFSLKSDQWQYIIMIIGLVCVIISGEVQEDILIGGNVEWAIWGGICLLAGPFLDGQQYQRAKKVDSITPFIAGSIFFALYLILVALAYFANSDSIILALIVIAVATSTIDSAVASIQEISGNQLAVFISIGTLITWPLFMTNTAAEIWSWYASGRVFIVIPLIILGWYCGRAKKTRI